MDLRPRVAENKSFRRTLSQSLKLWPSTVQFCAAFGEPTMTKDEILKKHKQYLFPSISTYYSNPLVTDHASMQYLWDVQGNKYLDFFGGIVTISVGHANPRGTSKVKSQLDN